MRSLIYKTYTNPRYAKVIHWGKLVTITGSAQLIVQVTGLVCGFIIIRALSTQEYAYYTLANTMLGTIILLSDSGISASIMSQGAKVWDNKEQLGSVLNTGLKLRRKFAFVSLILVIPVLIYLLHTHGATLITIILICLSIIPAFFASVSDSLLEIVPRLHQNIKKLQINQASVSLSRLIITTIVLIYPLTFIAILAAGLTRMYGNIRLRTVANSSVNIYAPVDETVKQNILKNVKKILPGSIYYCFSSQISIWIISLVGSSTSIAEVGALGRLGMLLNLFSVMISTLIVPRFAKLPNNRRLLLRKFNQTILILILFSVVMSILTYLFPKQILFILGNQYKDLSVELLLSVIISCLGLIMGTIYSLSLSRSYNISPIINIGVHILSQIILIMVMDLSTTKNVLIFSIIDCVIIILMFIANYFYYIRKTTVS